MVPRFDLLFRDPEVNGAVFGTPGPRDWRKCLGVCGDTTKCLRQRGGDDSRCLNLFFQSRGCLASALAADAFGAMDACMGREQSYNRCASPLRRMHGAVERALAQLADDTEMSAPEKTAWQTCGSPTKAQSAEHLNVILGCSMQHVCPAQLDRFVDCEAQAGRNCGDDARELLTAFRPYMEKLWLKDPQFLVRGTSEPVRNN